MKKWLLFILIGFLTSSCWDLFNAPDIEYTAYSPILSTRAELENSILIEGPKDLKSPGKIYSKDQFLFISDRFNGVHIYDNSDPKNPVNLGFIRILGAFDIAMKNKVLYVDNAVDLVALDLSNPEQIEQTQRIKNVFPEPPPPDGLSIPNNFLPENRPENTIIVGWKLED